MAQQHTVTSYDQELESLGRKIAEMGGIAEKMLSDAMDALSGLDTELAQSVVSADARLDLCLLYTSPSPRDLSTSRMPSSA